jgi:hypothetical protein
MWIFFLGGGNFISITKQYFCSFHLLHFVKGKKVILFIVNVGTLDLVDGYLIFISH